MLNSIVRPAAVSILSVLGRTFDLQRRNLVIDEVLHTALHMGWGSRNPKRCSTPHSTWAEAVRTGERSAEDQH